MDTTKLNIKFGALHDSIRKQITQQGFGYIVEEIKLCQHLADAVTSLYIHGIINQAQANAFRERIGKEVMKHVRKNKKK